MSTELLADEQITIPGAPEIAGLRFRRFRGAEDFQFMVEVVNANAAADGLQEARTADDLARDYQRLRNSDINKDLVIVEIDSKVVAYKRVMWWLEEATGTYIYSYFVFVAPEARGKGLELPLMRHSEERLREVAAEAGHPADAPRFFQTGIIDTREELRDLLLSEGYSPVRTFYDMLRPNLDDIPDIPLPEGIEVRPVKPEHYRAIRDAEVEAFKDHWGESTVEEDDYERWLNQSPFQPHLWQVAWDGDQVAGMIRNYIDEKTNEKFGRKRGWVENISTRRPWRKRGIAHALIARSFKMHKELGMTEAALGVDSENPSGALKIYLDMGFQVTKSFTDFRKPLT